MKLEVHIILNDYHQTHRAMYITSSLYFPHVTVVTNHCVGDHSNTYIHTNIHTHTYIHTYKHTHILNTFYNQLMHITLKNAELLKRSKLDKNAPTSFGLHRNHLQGAKVSAMAAYCDL